jgi:phage baseplate assembly protein W
MSNIKQYYDIKFPFTCNNLEGFFIDLNKTVVDKKESEILHVLLTPKKTRIRKPDFGTDLIKFIFEQNDELSWSEVQSEILSTVNKYVTNVDVKNVEVREIEHDLFVSISYKIQIGNKTENKELIVKL